MRKFWSEEVGDTAAWPVIIHQSMAHTDYAGIFRHKQLKLRNGVIPGSVIFPHSNVAFLIVHLSQSTCPDPSSSGLQLSQELIDRIERFLQVHRKCYVLCQAPLHGPSERRVFSDLQRRYLNTRLNMLPVHNANEAVKTMLTIAEALCKPASHVISEKLKAVITEQLNCDHMIPALKLLGLTDHQCQVVEDGLGSLAKLAQASREELIDCSLSPSTADKILHFFRGNIVQQ